MSKWPRHELEMIEEEDSLFDQRELLIHNKQTHEKVKWKQKVLKTVALSMAFFCVGLCIAIPGPTLIELGRRVHRDTEHMTFIFTARSVGFLIGSLVGGILFDFFDQQILLFYTLSIVAVATAGVPWCTALLTLSALICTQGVAIGVLDTGGNVFCIKIWGKRSAPFMQILHFAFGIGAFLAPLIARPFLFDGGIFDNSTMGSHLPGKKVISSLGGNRIARDLSGLNYLHQGYVSEQFHSEYIEQLPNYDTGQDAVSTEMSGFSPNWHKDDFYKNARNLNKKHGNAAIEDGRVPGFMKVRMKRESSNNQTVIGKGIKMENATQVLGGSTVPSVKGTIMSSQPQLRPKKPDFNNGEGLSKEHADAAEVNSIISDLKKKAPKINPETEKVTTPRVTIKGDSWNVTSRVGINDSHVWNSTDDFYFPWTSHVSTTAETVSLEPASRILPTSVAVDNSATIADSVTSAVTPAVVISVTASDTSTVAPAASSATATAPTTTSTTTKVTTTTPNSTTVTPPTVTTSATTMIPTTAATTTTTSPTTTSSTTTSVTAASTKASSIITASTTTNKSTALKPETTGDIFKGVVSTLTGMSKIQFAYTVIGLLLTVTAGLFLFLHCKDRSIKSPLFTRQNQDLTRNTFSAYFVSSVILLLFCFFLAYMGMEVTFGGLLMTFAVEYSVEPLTPSEGATLTALFWGCLAFGRGCSIFIARCVKPSRMMLMNLGLTMFGALILSFSIPVNPAALWVGTVTFGLGMSSLFPTAISWADSCYPLSGKATAVFVAGCGVGEMTVPILTGYLYEVKNKMAVMYVMLFLSCLLSVLYVAIQVLVYQKVKSGQRKSISGFMRLKNLEDMDEDSDLGIAEGINLGVTETIWRRRLQGEEERGKENGEGSKFTEFAKLIEM